jgi:hypothetical protein
MIDQTYLVALKPPSLAVQHVIAASIEIHGEHLVFLNAEGKTIGAVPDGDRPELERAAALICVIRLGDGADV